jgi:hypothetical protein
MRKRANWIVWPLILLVSLALLWPQRSFFSGSLRQLKTKLTAAPAQKSQTVVASPLQQQKFAPGGMASGSGEVIRLLPDDNKGSRHQRFIIKLSSGQTLLIAHNIDIAPRVENLNIGDTVSFFGQYEANDKGGVIHWTHRDPKGQHMAGWLNHKRKMYQ